VLCFEFYACPSCSGLYRFIWINLELPYFFSIKMDDFEEAKWERCRSQWPRGLRRRSAAARLLRLWVRTPTGAWISVSCEYYVLSGRGFCDELITRPQKSYWLCCVVVCDLATSCMRRPCPLFGRSAKIKEMREILMMITMKQTYSFGCRGSLRQM
jgi:hypothetical protein